MEPKHSLLEAKQKLEAYCAYQERCDQEIRKKVRPWGMYSEDVDILISDLIQNNFLNEERFASAFVSGKFRIKRWGRIKIRQHLKQKNISNYSINKGLGEIDEQEYLDTLNDLAVSKNALTKAKNKWDRLAKMQRYLQSKGYENDLIREILNQVLDGDQ
ncbi:MAG: regulatory protein [Crocinitomix sp.]